MASNRLKGHALENPYFFGTAEHERAKCQCGAESRDCLSVYGRRRWQKEHLEEVREMLEKEDSRGK